MQSVKDYEVERELLDVNDLCVCLGIGKTTAYKLLNSEDFPTVRIGRRIYANRSEINKWISCRVKAEEKGIQNRQLLWYVMDVFSNWWKSGTSLSSLPLPREKREREKQKRKNQRKEKKIKIKKRYTISILSYLIPSIPSPAFGRLIIRQ